MKPANLIFSNQKRPTGVAGLKRVLSGVVLFLIVASTSKANLISPVQASRETTRMRTDSVIHIGVGSYLSNPEPGDWDWGWAVVNSVQLAVDQANALGGIDIGGTLYTLYLDVVDDGCDSSQAISAANTLLNAGAVAVVAHSCSSASLAAQSLYDAAGVAMVSPSSTSPYLTRQGYPTTFRTISHDGSNPVLLATYFRSWMDFSRSAIVVGSEENWGNQLGDNYSDTFTGLGGTITSRREVDSLSDTIAALNAIKAENPDAIYYIDMNPTQAGDFSLLAYTLGLENVTIGWSSGDQVDDSILTDYLSAAGTSAAENDYVALQYRRFEDMPGWVAFLSEYQAASFPNEPDNPGSFGVFAYDAARMIIDAIDQADSTDPEVINNQLAAIENYQGLAGTYQGFNDCGDVIPQWAWLEGYQNGEWRFLVQSAPASACTYSEIFLPVIMREY